MIKNTELPPIVSHRYADPGGCIYCGAQKYAADSSRHLAEEHIIPFSLNGDLVIPRASCRRCERITGRDESTIINGCLASIRRSLGLRTRRPKDVPKFLPIYTDIGKVMVDIDDYPLATVFVVLGRPPILIGGPENVLGTKVINQNFDIDFIAKKYRVKEFSLPIMPVTVLNRVLAKIAHSFLVATLGVSGFSPIIADRILDKNDYMTDLVGGVGSFEEDDSENLHDIIIENDSQNGKYIVVRLRLLGLLGAPTFRVVSGVYL